MRSSSPGFVEVVNGAGQVYNEAAFRYFLSLELRRANRSARRLLLVLVSLRLHERQRESLSPDTAAAVFSVLAACVREVDFVGWHREQVVAAALLTMSGTSVKAKHTVCARVMSGLDQKLAPEDAARLHVRAVELGRRPRS
jgi:hypothetical protein